MSPILEIKTILLGAGSDQGVVLSVSGATAEVSTSAGVRRVQTDIPVTASDLVTVRGGRIISKRTGGQGGAVKTYNV